jgi:hypothetical protein
MPDPTPETVAVPLFTSAEAARPASTTPEVENPAPEPASAPAIPAMGLKDAVHNCRKAYNQTLAAEKAHDASNYAAKEKAAEAYCTSLPLLTSEGNIRAFIACVAHGMAIEVIGKDKGLKLIWAARAALASLPRESRPVGRPRINPQKA